MSALLLALHAGAPGELPGAEPSARLLTRITGTPIGGHSVVPALARWAIAAWADLLIPWSAEDICIKPVEGFEPISIPAGEPPWGATAATRTNGRRAAPDSTRTELGRRRSPSPAPRALRRSGEGHAVRSGAGVDGRSPPIVNQEWHDARTYCDWAGLALPDEAG